MSSDLLVVFCSEVFVDRLVEALVTQLSEVLYTYSARFCITVVPPLSAGLITMLVFAKMSLSALSCVVLTLFFVGHGRMVSCRPISFIMIMGSRLLLPIGGLY